MNKNNIDNIRQALSAAESSIKLAKQLLSEIEGGNFRNEARAPKEKDGIVGTFDGEIMVTEQGEKHSVPANYASKSMLVVGDKLKLVEEASGKRFKQIEHVKRHRTEGILAKKDGKWKAVTPEGSYRVLPEAIEHFGGDAGDEVRVHLPASNLSASFAAIESLVKKASPPPESTEEKVFDKPSEEKRPARKAESKKPFKEREPEKKKPEVAEKAKKEEAKQTKSEASVKTPTAAKKASDEDELT